MVRNKEDLIKEISEINKLQIRLHKDFKKKTISKEQYDSLKKENKKEIKKLEKKLDEIVEKNPKEPKVPKPPKSSPLKREDDYDAVFEDEANYGDKMGDNKKIDAQDKSINVKNTKNKEKVSKTKSKRTPVSQEKEKIEESEKSKPQTPKSVGEQAEEIHRKERFNLRKDIEETGVIKPKQAEQTNSFLGKFKKAFGKKKEKSPEGVSSDFSKENFPVNVSVSEMVNLRKLINGQEKLKLKVETLGERKEFSTQQIKDITETLGELRAMFFQKDKQISKNTTQLTLLSDSVKEIEPRKIQKKIEKIRGDVTLYDMRFERVEKKLNKVFKQVEANKKVLSNIKSVQNFIKETEALSKDVQKMKSLKLHSQRYAEMAEKSYMELNKSLSELATFENKVETFEELINETVRDVDKNRIVLEKKVDKQQINGIKSEVDGFKESIDKITQLKEQVKSQVGEVNKALTGVEEKQKELDVIQKDMKNLRGHFASFNKKFEKSKNTIKKLQLSVSNGSFGIKQKEGDFLVHKSRKTDKEAELEELMIFLKEEFIEGRISKESYKEAMGTNKKILENVRQNKEKIRQFKRKIEKWKAQGLDVTILEKEVEIACQT